MVGWKPRPFIFVHIPKCGGSSIEQALIPIATTSSGFKNLAMTDRFKFWLPGPAALQHSMLQNYAEHFPLGDYFKFSFVRNPWDRAVSQIFYLKNTFADAAALFPGSNFKEHLRVYCHTSRTIRAQNLGACQCDYLLDATGKIAVDFLGKFENLREDYCQVCDFLGIEPIPPLSHLMNSRRNRHYRTYYDADSAEWIRTRFAKDIEYFNYDFDATTPTHD